MWVGRGVWNGFLLGKARKEDVLMSISVGKGMAMDIYFGSVLSPPLLPSSMFGIFLNLLFLCPLDRSKWPRCLLWHGWLPGLSGICHRDLWATSFGDLASFHLERCLGAYPVDFASSWTTPEYWDAADIALEMPEHPNVWTDGSREAFLFYWEL